MTDLEKMARFVIGLAFLAVFAAGGATIWFLIWLLA